MRPALVLLAATALLAGCGGSKTAATTAPPATGTGSSTTVTGPSDQMTTFLIYTVDSGDGKLVAERRSVPHTQAVAAAALSELADAPNSKVPRGLSVTIANGDATVTGADLSGVAEAQVVYTLTQFSTVKTVNGKTRADVEQYVPAILVESPTPGETVTSPVHVTGNANTFEATFQYKLLDASGNVLAKNFVTATSGSGTRGTFDVSIPYTLDAAQDGKLVVYENSAENGSVIHEREIPLRLSAS